jgi:alpha-tubulin suppressor-like RCC1 family protein
LIYACLLTDQGEVYSWGDNTFKQLGYDFVTKKNQAPFMNTPKRIDYFADQNIKVTQISCSKGEKHNHMGCVTDSGRVFMWGDPYKGQLGLYLDDKGWTHEETSLYPTPLEMNLKFLKAEPPKSNNDLLGGDEEMKSISPR